MKKVIVAIGAWMAPAVSMAAEAAAAGGSHEGAGMYFTASVVTAGFGLAVATLCAALGQGKVAGAAMEAIARQPEAAPKIQTAMLLGLAFIESLVIYALLISFILLFVNPFKGQFGG